MPARSAQAYAAPGSVTRPIAPTAKKSVTPTSHGRLPPWRSDSHGTTNEHGIAVRFMQAISSPAELSLQPRSPYASGSHAMSP